MIARKHLTIASLCLITACAPISKPAEELPTNQEMPVAKREAQTATVSSFEINGALAAKAKSKGWSATLNWLQTGPGAYQIHLVGPLGGGSLFIKGSGGSVTLQDGAKKVTSGNADELLAKETGIRLPVHNLYYWIRGLPAPGGAPAQVHDKYNHLVKLKQSGYNIDFTKYTSVNGIDLPSMIRLEGNGVMIKVIIKSWRVLG